MFGPSNWMLWYMHAEKIIKRPVVLFSATNTFFTLPLSLFSTFFLRTSTHGININLLLGSNAQWYAKFCALSSSNSFTVWHAWMVVFVYMYVGERARHIFLVVFWISKWARIKAFFEQHFFSTFSSFWCNEFRRQSLCNKYTHTHALIADTHSHTHTHTHTCKHRQIQSNITDFVWPLVYHVFLHSQFLLI